MNSKSIKCLFFSVLICGSLITRAQSGNSYDFNRIEDNSFLLEEAYNQEPGVIQHISAFQYMKDKTWSYSFTDEWPVTGQTHQLSATIPVLHADETGIGDILINYRYQAILRERLAFSPRFSLILPTGNYKKGLGSGVPGYQVNLPLSFICSHKLVTHYNIGATLTPSAKDFAGNRSDNTNINYGASAIVLLSETFNLMFEVAGNSTYINPEGFKIEKYNSLFLNPGFRYAVNCKSGLQIVPGLAVPIGIGSSGGQYGVFAYLSFEHPLKRQK
ncbi:MAG TPA: hypothetical protein PKH02_00280 [Bacteroidales bacterium]|nr:hypothetical protein [Bacteroidales bacterium]